MNTSNELKNIYFDWLMKNYSFTDLSDNVVEIITPFLDNHFDCIVIYAEFLKNGKIRLTDDGWTLENQGTDFVEANRKTDMLTTITSHLGIEMKDGELSIMTDRDKFPIAKQRLLQAIIQVIGSGEILENISQDKKNNVIGQNML